MAYREGDRNQMSLLPQAIEEYVGPNDPVRAYDAIIEALNMEKLGLAIDSSQVGNPAYNPKSMLKLLVYGCSYGWRSSRKLERACYHNLSFIWLMGGLKPDHKTIANFKTANEKIIEKVLKQTARLCIKLGLIEGNCLFTDSTKVRGAASINQTLTRKGWEQKLMEVDRRIEQLLKEYNQTDERETGTLMAMEKELQDKERLGAKIKGLLEQMEKENLKQINGTDPNCVNFKSRQGSHAGYSAHVTVDEKNGLIVSADVVSESNDSNQFSAQVIQAVETLENPCQTVVADAGYSNLENLKEMVAKEIDVIVPTQRQVLHHPKDNPFGKDKFRYDPANDQYICPEGKRLKYSHSWDKKAQRIYRIEQPSPCPACPHWGVCTTSRRRATSRMREEELREKLEARYASDEGQAIYKKRKEKAEHPFGHIKRNLNASAFLSRGLGAAKAEWALCATCFDMRRMITLLGGVDALVRHLGTTNA